MVYWIWLLEKQNASYRMKSLIVDGSFERTDTAHTGLFLPVTGPRNDTNKEALVRFDVPESQIDRVIEVYRNIANVDDAKSFLGEIASFPVSVCEMLQNDKTC